MLTATTINASIIIIEPLPLIWAFPLVLLLASIVLLCILGNILVILSVFTFRPLRTVQNFFIVSLAFSDMLVAIIVMPFHIVTHVLKRWIFGRRPTESIKCHWRLEFLLLGQIFCQIFVTSDIFLCTASILNLCAIAVSTVDLYSTFLILFLAQLDRYWAISDPIQYARQRTIRRVLVMILIVWVLSAMISIPPIIATMFGSKELQNFNAMTCELSDHQLYVIYSACGSFYIPGIIMTIVYTQVFLETRRRFRERAKGKRLFRLIFAWFDHNALFS